MRSHVAEIDPVSSKSHFASNASLRLSLRPAPHLRQTAAQHVGAYEWRRLRSRTSGHQRTVNNPVRTRFALVVDSGPIYRGRGVKVHILCGVPCSENQARTTEEAGGLWNDSGIARQSPQAQRGDEGGHRRCSTCSPHNLHAQDQMEQMEQMEPELQRISSILPRLGREERSRQPQPLAAQAKMLRSAGTLQFLHYS